MKTKIPMAIYRCRCCGQQFEKEGILQKVNIDGDTDIPVPVGCVYGYHKCADGTIGIGDIIGGYMKERRG